MRSGVGVEHTLEFAGVCLENRANVWGREEGREGGREGG